VRSIRRYAGTLGRGAGLMVQQQKAKATQQKAAAEKALAERKAKLTPEELTAEEARKAAYHAMREGLTITTHDMRDQSPLEVQKEREKQAQAQVIREAAKEAIAAGTAVIHEKRAGVEEAAVATAAGNTPTLLELPKRSWWPWILGGGAAIAVAGGAFYVVKKRRAV
jgi:hypothetical protein